MQHEERLTLELPVLPVKQRREQVEVEVKVEVKVEVRAEVKVEVEVEIQEKTQARTRLRTLPPVLPGEQRMALCLSREPSRRLVSSRDTNELKEKPGRVRRPG